MRGWRRPLVGALVAALPVEAHGQDQALLVAGAGVMGLRDADRHLVEAELQYRGRPLWWKLGPQIGLLANDQGTLYPWAAIAAAFEVTDRLIVTPSFGPGWYGRGSGKKLGSALEFRSAIEIGWRFDNGLRLGLEAYHISNAGIGVHNPGVEGAALTVALPLTALFQATPPKDPDSPGASPATTLGGR